MLSHEKSPVRMMPNTWRVGDPINSQTSQRWSNPDDWKFAVVQKAANFNPVNFLPMLRKLWKRQLKEAPLFKAHEELKSVLGPAETQILWIGHATLLIRIGGTNILTDPVFSEVAGPSSIMGYKRMRKPATTVEELKMEGIEVHVVIISHNHYDHLDEQSVKDLNKYYPKIKWFVPMGLKSTILSWILEGKDEASSSDAKEDDVKEFNWWNFCEESDLEFHFTPAKHWSGRGTLDWYKSLWGSWIIKSPKLTCFFVGDTGYQPELFDAIHKTFPVIDVAAIPIGPYEPRQMLKCQHINPEEAVRIHTMLNVKKSVGINWATFQLGIETMEQTKHDLRKAMAEHNLEEGEFQTLEDTLITSYKKDDKLYGTD